MRISSLKRESPHEMGIKEIKVPDSGTEIGLNLMTSERRGQAYERRLSLICLAQSGSGGWSTGAFIFG